MSVKVCPICRNKFFSENKYSESGLSLHDYCELKKTSKRSKKQRSFRTSTPVADYDSSPTSSFSDSVSDFFYQSWKSGLHSEVKKSQIKSPNQWNHQSYTILQPVCYSPQFVYMYVQCVQQVGYRSDGTFGILPSYWIWNFN